MDTTANEPLMVIVERIVRPILAPFARKMTMRQELLTHLQEIYAEELARVSDPVLAVKAAQSRLGTPNDLRKELQKTVPVWVQWANRLDRMMVKSPAESDARFALRVGATLGVLMASVLLLSVALIGLLQGRNLFQLIADFFAFLGLVFGLVAAASTRTGLWVVRPEIESQTPLSSFRWQRLAGSLAIGLVIAAAATALSAWSNRDLFLLSRLALGGFAGGAVMFPLVCELFIQERRQSRPWDLLDLDDHAQSISE